jgi:hypothetical protein
MQATRALYERIQLGMTLAEADAVLAPAGFKKTSSDAKSTFEVIELDEHPFSMSGGWPESWKMHWWRRDSNWIEVLLIDDKTAARSWRRQISDSELKARNWLYWARGLVGL